MEGLYAHQDQTVVVQFQCASKMVFVSLFLRRGDDVGEVLQRFFATEAIPLPLETTLYSAVYRLLKTEMNGPTGAVASLQHDKGACDQSLKVWSRIFSQKCMVWTTTDRTYHSHYLSDTDVNTAIEFAKMIQQICDSNGGSSHLIDADDNLFIEMERKVEAHHEEVECLQQRQAEEMVHQVQVDETGVSTLVVQHVEEANALSERHTDAVQSLRDKQRMKFKAYAYLLHSCLEGDTDHVLRPVSLPIFGDYKQVTPSGTSLLQLSSSSSSSLRLDSEDDKGSSTADLRSTSNTNLSFSVKAMRASFGPRSAEQYTVERISGCLNWLRENQRKNTDPARMKVHAGEMSALISVTDEKLKYDGAHGASFASILQQRTDMQLASFDDQRESILSSLKSPLEVGDVVCTKHTNVPGCEIVFHLISETPKRVREDDVYSVPPLFLESRLLVGLRYILLACIEYGIDTVAIPMFLLNHDASALPAFTVASHECTSRAMVVMRTVKQAMASDNAQQIARVRFLLPPLRDDISLLYDDLIKDLLKAHDAS